VGPGSLKENAPNKKLERDPEKWIADFRKDHAQSKTWSAMVIQPNPIAL
jgi:hypothetical protein